jgi:hypothetical protein
MDLDLIDSRVMVKSFILQGDIENAVRALNDLNPEVSGCHVTV